MFLKFIFGTIGLFVTNKSYNEVKTLKWIVKDWESKMKDSSLSEENKRELSSCSSDLFTNTLYGSSALTSMYLRLIDNSFRYKDLDMASRSMGYNSGTSIMLGEDPVYKL